MFYSLATRPASTLRRNYAPIVNNGALDQFLSDTLSSFTTPAAPRSAQVDDGETHYTLQMDVPGLAKDQLDIGIEGDVVRVTSKADAPRSVKAAWRFPLEIDVAGSSATLEHGVLNLRLAKRIPVSNVARLEIL